MYYASKNEHFAAVELLHKLGADLNRPLSDGKTPAFAAASKGDFKMVKLLADLGADVNRADHGGKFAQNGKTRFLNLMNINIKHPQMFVHRHHN